MIQFDHLPERKRVAGKLLTKDEARLDSPLM
jgi:hypothetical protein